MDQEEKNTILLMQGKDGSVVKTKITQSQRDRIFSNEGGVKRDQVHMFLPEPVWEKIYANGRLLYEGFTVDHLAFGAGKVFYADGKPKAEGIFGFKGLVCGREYYPNGIIRFEGSYRINHAYGPNFPEYGSWYDENGKLKYRGAIRISRSSLGWPMVVEPKGFSWERRFQPEGHMFGWNVAEKYIKQAAPDAYDIAQEETIQDILDEEKAEECTEETKKDRKRWSGFQSEQEYMDFLDQIYDETPLFKVHHKRGLPGTEMALRLGWITEEDLEEDD